MAHSAGTWTVRIEDLRGGRYFVVVRGDDCETIDIHEHDNGEADANLIAAAPDLFAAAESLVDHMMFNERPSAGILDMFREALAKARGELP